MPILIVTITLLLVCVVVLVVSMSPGHPPAVREGLWAFSRYLTLFSMVLLGPVLVVLQMTVGVMPLGQFLITLGVGVASAVALVYAIDHARDEFHAKQALAARRRQHEAVRQVRATPAPVPRDRIQTPRERYERALSLLDGKLYEDAIIELSKLIEIDPEHADAHQALGNAYNLSGESHRALQEFQAAFTIRARKMTETD